MQKCVDCTHEFKPRRANAKRCDFCRLAQTLDYWLTRTKQCYLCDKKFLPTGSKSLEICAECQPVYMAPIHDEPCLKCGEKRKLLHPEVKWCFHCAETPTLRRGLVKAVFRKQAERMVQSSDAA